MVKRAQEEVHLSGSVCVTAFFCRWMCVAVCSYRSCCEIVRHDVNLSPSLYVHGSTGFDMELHVNWRYISSSQRMVQRCHKPLCLQPVVPLLSFLFFFHLFPFPFCVLIVSLTVSLDIFTFMLRHLNDVLF